MGSNISISSLLIKVLVALPFAAFTASTFAIVSFPLFNPWISAVLFASLIISLLLIPLISRRSLINGYVSSLTLVLTIAYAIGSQLSSGCSSDDVTDAFVNNSMRAPLEKFKIDVGRYPSTEEGLQALITSPEGLKDQWQGPYIEKLPIDPWANPYQYKQPGTRNPTRYDLWSWGPDGHTSEDDIGNW